MTAPKSAARPFPWTLLGLAAVIVLTLALTDHRVRFAYSRTPDVLFWDQWDLYNPLFNGEAWWKSFTYQHGPHRQGLGGLVNATLARLTHWDVRGDAVLTVLATAGAALAALPLARRCGARPGLTLATIPIVFLTLRQFEAWIGPANPAHGAFPILLTMLYGLTWFMRSAPARLGCQVLLTFFLVFTGFGLFAGAISPVLLGLEAWHARADRRRALLAAGACALTVLVWALFFVGYKSQPAAPNFHFPHERPWEYLYFSGLMFSSYAGLHGSGVIELGAGILLFLLVGAVAVVHGLRVLRGAPSTRPESTVLLLLSAGTLLYCVNTAVGRVSLGWQEAPFAPRYIPLVVPAILALFIQAERWRATWLRHAGWAALFALAAWSGLSLDADDRNAVNWYVHGREKWREVYLATGSQAAADAATSPDQNFTIYPADLSAKLDYLRRHHLSLFRPPPAY